MSTDKEEDCQKKKVPICPLTRISDYPGVECITAKCAWYIAGNYQECAIKAIVSNLYNIVKQGDWR